MAWNTPDGPIPSGTITRSLNIPDDERWDAIVTGAIYELSLAQNFQQIGDLTPEEVSDRFRQMFEEFLVS